MTFWRNPVTTHCTGPTTIPLEVGWKISQMFEDSGHPNVQFCSI